MPKQKQKKGGKLSLQEIQEQLFDGLMLQIEPDLALPNRSATIEKFERLPAEEHRKWLAHYEEAYALFFENWPRYIAAAMQSMEALYGDLQAAVLQQDQARMQQIEDALGTSPDSP